MKLTAIRALTIAAVLAGMAGCQSGPRWAWWKHETAPEDTSLVARSAAPVLPSAQSTPQAIAAAGMEPAAPPSSANLAAATQAIPGLALPAASATITNAPIANYPAIKTPGSNITAAPSAAPASATTMVPQIAASSVPPSGPYDPNAYQPSAALSVASPDDAGEFSPPGADRYGITAATAADNKASILSAGAPPADDRYGQTLPDRLSNLPLASVATPSASVASNIPPVAATAPPAIPANPSSPAVAQLTSAPGQYRPGGTSSYTSGPTAQPIEVATRPASPASVNVPPQENLPIGTSVPWSPPATTTPANGSGTRTY